MLRGIRLLKGVPDDYQGPTLSNPWSTIQRGPIEPAGTYTIVLRDNRIHKAITLRNSLTKNSTFEKPTTELRPHRRLK